MEKTYIDKNIRIFRGQEAEKFLNIKNDSVYIKENSILNVDSDRWKEAQFYERKTWMETGLNLRDDRNYEHFERFEKYSSLLKLDKKFNSVIELGCGPFTNLRTILHLLPEVKGINLLDPLILDYLNHPNCSYKNKKINGIDVITHATPIENFVNNQKFDLVIMNNVLEHCFDIEKIFDNILNMMDKGSIFIFSDVYFESSDISSLVKILYDSGHPLKITKEYMSEFLKNFETLYEKDFHGLYNQSWRHDKYFIGRLK